MARRALIVILLTLAIVTASLFVRPRADVIPAPAPVDHGVCYEDGSCDDGYCAPGALCDDRPITPGLPHPRLLSLPLPVARPAGAPA